MRSVPGSILVRALFDPASRLPGVGRSSISGRVVGLSILGIFGVIAVVGPSLVGTDPTAMSADALRAPDPSHPFGTDDLGRDVLASVIHGTRSSLIVGLLGAFVATAVALAVGGTAALGGGSVDHLLMRGTEFVQSLPRFFLIVLIVSLFGSQHVLIIFVIGLTSWPATARVFRAQALSVLGREFVAAARAAGGSDFAILARHVWPLAQPVVLAEAAYTVGGAILAEAGLSFLGLGDPGIISWGALLGSAQHFVREAWWMSIFPGAAITLVVLACNLIADSFVTPRQL
jgi:peptide/nickel transport system permease protein